MDSGGEYSGVLAEVFSQARPMGGEKIRFRCECAYDGTDFCGWQSQKGGGSVQDFIEERLGRIFKEPVRIHGSGRSFISTPRGAIRTGLCSRRCARQTARTSG